MLFSFYSQQFKIFINVIFFQQSTIHPNQIVTDIKKKNAQKRITKIFKSITNIHSKDKDTPHKSLWINGCKEESNSPLRIK